MENAIAAIQPRKRFCDRCHKLDLGSYSKLLVKRGRGTIAFIGKVSIRRDCELCAQFGQIFKALKSVRSEVSNHDSFTLDFRQIQVDTWRGIYFRVRFMEFNRVLDFDFDFYSTTAMIQDGLSNPVFLCRAMSAVSSDFELAREWLRTCRSSHANCQHTRARSETLRVIDCRRKQLLVVDSSEPYVCLSYVWGNSSTSGQVDMAKPLDSIPQTITDAMVVTLELGMTYLWVDRYCIDQNNPEEKHDIIRNMDRIYQGAEITIVASAGADPHYGLPGVYHTPRRHQLNLSAGEETFVSVENIREQINVSNWNSRGWTYQEMLLSCRRLVFTDSQMYFQCGSAHYLEGLHMAATAQQSPLHERFRAFPATNINDIQSRLAEYYARNLSVASDVIHAISGVCNSSMASTNTSVRSDRISHFYGIPVFRSASETNILSKAFLRNLAWRVLHRDDALHPLGFPILFPTWSWASVKARYQSGSLLGEYVKPPMLTASCSDLKFHLLSKKGPPKPPEFLLREGLKYTDFDPHLLLNQGHLLTGPFTAILESSLRRSTIYLDSREALQSKNLAALYLGYDVRERPDSEERVANSDTTSVVCLLLQLLTPEQKATLLHPTRLHSYHRVGLWIQDSNVFFNYAFESEEALRGSLCAELCRESGRLDWEWQEQSFLLT